MHLLRNHSKSDRRGFALIVVLSLLIILTSLFAIAQSRSMTAVQAASADHKLLAVMQTKTDFLRLAIAALVSDPNVQEIVVDGGTLVLQDVGGLIDLNTAAPELLQFLADGFGIPSTEMTKYREWRQTPHRSLSNNDFFRIAGISFSDRVILNRVVTVSSGRSGIATQVAPAELWQLIARQPAAISETLKTEPSGTVFLVLLRSPKNTIPLGTIKIGTDLASSTILE